ncbi:sugar kinase [Mycobacterium sp. URHB0044]|uniref:sugar kinase n=1 Tax=Mycobacterium sp. URHB0044 TaxID=1380386 RepID=UPI000490E8FE|nr:sugar kinase [Mycobacterium sp. URHB0044]
MSVLTFGETMALLRPTGTGPLAHTTTMHLGIGGAESNVAVALRRLGAEVTWVGRVGDDSFGDLVERELRAEDLRPHVVRDHDAPTGLMVKERRTASATRVWYYRDGSAGSRFAIGDVPETLWDTVTLLHVTGITPALSDSAAKATVHYVEHAKGLGITVSFDVNHRHSLWSADEARPTYRVLVALADVVFAGADEAAIVVGSGTPAQLAVGLCAMGPAEAVVKLGADGALAVVDGVEYRQPAVPVSVIDTVGAGDGFVAGYLADRLAGCDIQQRLRTATAVGALACTVDGDWEGMPRRDELDLLTTSEPVAR